MKQIQVFAAAPLSMGLLTADGPPDWHPASFELRSRCSAASKFCQEKGVNLSKLAIVYSLSIAIESAVIGNIFLGMKNPEEVRDALEFEIIARDGK